MSLVVIVEGDEYRLIRERTAAGGKLLWEKFVEGAWASAGAATARDTQALIETALGLDFEAFKNTVYFGQGDVKRFADPSTTDAERKSVLRRVLGLDVLESVLAEAKAKRDEAKAQCQQLSVERRAALSHEQEARSDLPELKTRVKQAQQARDQAREELSQLSRIQAEREQWEASGRELAEAEVEIARYCNQAAEHRASLRELNARLEEHQRSFAAADRGLKLFQSGKCPTCETPISSAAVKRRMAALQKEAKQAQLSVKGAEKEIGAAKSAQALALEAIEGVGEQFGAQGETSATMLDWARRQYANAIQEARRLDVVVARLEELRRQDEGVYAKALDDAQKAYKAREARAKEWARKGAEFEREGRVQAQIQERCEFWVKGFGPQGIVNFIIDSVVPGITERANHWLGILSDGDLIVSFDTQSELKGGGVRDKFSIELNVEGAGDVRPSGGQARKIAIAVDLALMELLATRAKASFNLMLMDEILDGLDGVGQSRVIELLQELRNKVESCWVISHSPNITDVFEHVITVTKEGGVATITNGSGQA